MGRSGTQVICRRARAGLIEARTERLLQDGKILNTCEISRNFWWAGGEAALNQNWATGDFDTWIDKKVYLEAFGVTFRRSDIERAKPAAAQHKRAENMNSGKHIFIGHGRSLLWRELKDFLNDRLGLDVDEFNRTATAGMPIPDRLNNMLNDAAFAFLILTAEDEQPDGTSTPRLNVIHEAGLFQGRLGFQAGNSHVGRGMQRGSQMCTVSGNCVFQKGRIDAEFEGGPPRA